MAELRRGVRLALDWGSARIGVAACDADATLAYPVETIPADAGALRRVAGLTAEYEPIEILLGLPIDMRGRSGPAAERMRQVAQELASAVAPVPVRLVDERLSTADSHRRLAAAGRDSRARRGIIDQVAAVAILDHALEVERGTGKQPGTPVVVGAGSEGGGR